MKQDCEVIIMKTIIYSVAHNIHKICTGEISALFPRGCGSNVVPGLGDRSCHRRGSEA